MKPSRNKVFCVSGQRIKMLFETETKANTFIRFNKDIILESNLKAPVRSYYCQLCGGWHVTSIVSEEIGKKIDQREADRIDKYLKDKEEADKRREETRRMNTLYNSGVSELRVGNVSYAIDYFSRILNENLIQPELVENIMSFALAFQEFSFKTNSYGELMAFFPSALKAITVSDSKMETKYKKLWEQMSKSHFISIQTSAILKKAEDYIQKGEFQEAKYELSLYDSCFKGLSKSALSKIRAKSMGHYWELRSSVIASIKKANMNPQQSSNSIPHDGVVIENGPKRETLSKTENDTICESPTEKKRSRNEILLQAINRIELAEETFHEGRISLAKNFLLDAESSVAEFEEDDEETSILLNTIESLWTQIDGSE